MSHTRRGDHLTAVQAMQLRTQAFEETFAGTQQYRHQADVHLVHQARLQVLPRGVRAPSERNVLPTRGSAPV